MISIINKHIDRRNLLKLQLLFYVIDIIRHSCGEQKKGNE